LIGPVTRSGAIILARHGKPALSRRVMLSARQYGDWWAQYEVLGLRPGQLAPDSLKALARKAGVVFASTRLRSIETATMVCDDRPFEREALLIEAPLPPPPLPGWFKLPPTVWGFVSRFAWWWFNYHGGQESRREAEVRAEAVADRLVALAAGGEDVLVLAHGFFNAMVARVLRRRGWRLTDDGGYKYWGARHFSPPAGLAA
jgi:broad specificity phosphatase PhoE